jgi:hypothetical protein
MVLHRTTDGGAVKSLPGRNLSLRTISLVASYVSKYRRLDSHKISLD